MTPPPGDPNRLRAHVHHCRRARRPLHGTQARLQALHQLLRTRPISTVTLLVLLMALVLWSAA